MKYFEVRDFKFNIKVDGVINIIGIPGSGKTTLLSIIINKIKNDSVFIDEKPLSNFDLAFLKQNIAVCLNSLTFNTANVLEELLFFLRKLNYDEKTALERVIKVCKFFNIEKIMNDSISDLSLYNKYLIKILSLLIINPSIYGIDDLMTFLNIEDKKKIIKYANANNICILNVTTNKEELLLGNYIVGINNHEVVCYDETEKVICNEKLLSSLGMKMPFIVDLSNGLNYYDVLRKNYFDSNSLIGEIWK